MRKKRFLLTTLGIFFALMFFTTTSLAADGQGSIKKGISQRVEALENLFEDLKDKVMGIDTDVQTLKDASAAADSKLEALNQNVANQSEEITALKQTIEDQNNKINELTNEVSTLRSDVDQLKSDIGKDGPNWVCFVKGQVTTEDGTPVKGAAVRLPDNGGYADALTDSDGNYTVGTFEPGTFPLVVAEKGYLVATVTNITVNEAAPTNVNLVLTEGGKIAGKVAIGEDLSNGAYVYLYDQNGQLVNKIGINDDGSYEFNAKEGTYTMIVEPFDTDGKKQSRTVTVTKNQTITEDFTME